METLEGTVSHLQHTVNVTGGGNSQARTTYIALFRLDSRPVQFSSGSPIAIADGDRIVAAGNAKAASLTAYACRNVTTGAVMNSGILGKTIMGFVLPTFGVFFCAIASLMLGRYAGILYLGFIAGAIYFFYQAAMAYAASKRVQNG